SRISATCRRSWTPGCPGTGGCWNYLPGTRPRSGRSSCTAGCCWSPGSARTRRSTSHNNSERGTPPGAATWPRPTSAGSAERRRRATGERGSPAQGARKGKASMFTSIAGRAVVVTGATRGIGKGIARVFAGAGARVLIVGRDAEAAKATVAELSATGADVSHVLADVSQQEDCQQIAATATE